jgi:hypothetical protein
MFSVLPMSLEKRRQLAATLVDAEESPTPRIRL